jgi:hypothetical protein
LMTLHLAFGHTTFDPPPHPIPHLPNHNLPCLGHPLHPLGSTWTNKQMPLF